MKASSAGLATLLTLSPLAARAADAEQPPPPPSYRLNFEAGDVELDDELKTLILSRNVVVQVDRYRLKSDRLELHRTPHGIVVQGSGEVAFCPCPDPPVTLGFRSALVAPPTDLLIEQPTLRVGGVPVFWLPYAWLRAPNRAGVLPPRFEWRQDEGFVAGSGVHVPIDATAIDVFGSGYFKGGARVAASASGSDAALSVVWDHYRQSALVVDGRGASVGTTGVVYAFDVDALRGARGRTATLSLDEAARREDRARAGVSATGGGAVIGTSIVAEGVRGGPLDAYGFVGPEAFGAVATPLGRSGAFETSMRVQSLQVPSRGAFSLLEPRAALHAALHPSVFDVKGELGAGLDLTVADNLAGAAARGTGTLEVSVPLARRFGSARTPWVHRIEPFVQGRALGVRTRDDFLDLGDGGDDEAAIGAAGLRTALGVPSARQSAELEVSGGWLATRHQSDAAAVGRMITDTEYVGTAATALWQPGRVATLSELRAGDSVGLHVTGFLEGRRGVEPLLGRWLERPNWDGALGGLFDRAGWTTGAEIVVPWAHWLASQGEVEADPTARRMLAYAGSLAYRHRCGCLALEAWAGHRLGRRGLDAWMTVDLMP